MSFSGYSEGSQGYKKEETQQGYQSNYFDINDIIATQQRVPCRFEKQVYNLGSVYFYI